MAGNWLHGVTLRRLPLSFVKIDQSFVQGIGDDPSDEEIVSASLTWPPTSVCARSPRGSRPNNNSIALREIGCNQAQGYLFARPLPPNDVASALEHAAWCASSLRRAPPDR